MRPFGITEFHIDVAGPCTDACAIADHNFGMEGDEIISVIACRHNPESDTYSGESIDITNGLCDGLVYFTLPDGMWRIFFIIKTRYGIHPTKLDFCDVLNPETIKLYIDEVYQPHYDHFKEYFGNTFLGFFSDEPGFRNNSRTDCYIEIGKPYTHYPWHKRVYDKLFEKYGDKTMSLLPGLWYNIEGISAQIRLDYMNIITDEYSTNFCNQLADWCHEHGVMYIGHIIEDNNAHRKTGSTAGHYFKSLDKQDMSGIDVVLHQIVPGLTECSNAGLVSYKHMENNFYHYELAKLASSFAHIDDRKKGRAMCEIFGAYGWAEGTKVMKYLTDHMIVRGINYFVPHAFSPKPNDTDCPPNFYDSGKNPQYKYFKDIMSYMERMCHLFNDGVHIPTCAILYDAEISWTSKDFIPIENIAKTLYDNLLDYDIIPISYLDKIDENGCINGEKYPLIIVPDADKIPDYAYNKLTKLSIPVISVSHNTKKSPFENILLTELVSYMKDTGLCDIKTDYNGKFLRYYHYTRNDVNYYMFSNEDINNTAIATIEISGFNDETYISYDVFKNKAVRKKSVNGKVEIELPPYHSVVIITGDNETKCEDYTPASIISSELITPVFEISTKREQDNEFTHYTSTDKLFNITGKDKLTRFSGNIKYDTTINIKETGNYILDLGEVGETAEVYLNKEKVGTQIIPPYSFDISDFVKAGENTLSIICANTNAYTYRDIFSRYMKFDASGVLGPITLKTYTK